MNPSLPSFENGAPVLAVGFDYPDEPDVLPTAKEYRLQGIRAVIVQLAAVRGIQAKGLHVEAGLFVMMPTGETVTAAAKRLGVSRKHFQGLVSGWQKLLQVTPGPYR